MKCSHLFLLVSSCGRICRGRQNPAQSSPLAARASPPSYHPGLPVAPAVELCLSSGRHLCCSSTPSHPSTAALIHPDDDPTTPAPASLPPAPPLTTIWLPEQESCGSVGGSVVLTIRSRSSGSGRAEAPDKRGALLGRAELPCHVLSHQITMEIFHPGYTTTAALMTRYCLRDKMTDYFHI